MAIKKERIKVIFLDTQASFAKGSYGFPNMINGWLNSVKEPDGIGIVFDRIGGNCQFLLLNGFSIHKLEVPRKQ